MSCEVITHNEEIGFHRWKDAPDEVAFLRALHRHIFVIECRFSVSDTDREIEIFMMEREISAYLHEKYGSEMSLDNTSCESLAYELMFRFNAISVEVREDGKGGACVRK